MEIPLIVTSIIPALIFGPLYWFVYRKNDNLSEMSKLAILGGTGWSALSIIMMIPFSFILEASSEKRYLEIFNTGMDDHRTILFWMVFVFALFSEVIKFHIVRTEKEWIGNYRSLFWLGTFWGLFEFFTRFLFFFDKISSNLTTLLFLLIYITVLNQGLSMIILRTEENTKFLMFSAIMCFFAELTLYGAFGHILTTTVRIGRLAYVLVLHVFIVYLSVLTRKPVSSSNAVPA